MCEIKSNRLEYEFYLSAKCYWVISYDPWHIKYHALLGVWHILYIYMWWQRTNDDGIHMTDSSLVWLDFQWKGTGNLSVISFLKQIYQSYGAFSMYSSWKICVSLLFNGNPHDKTYTHKIEAPHTKAKCMYFFVWAFDFVYVWSCGFYSKEKSSLVSWISEFFQPMYYKEYWNVCTHVQKLSLSQPAYDWNQSHVWFLQHPYEDLCAVSLLMILIIIVFHSKLILNCETIIIHLWVLHPS